MPSVKIANFKWTPVQEQEKNETLVVLEHPPERLESEGSEIELIYFVKIQSL